MYKAILGPKISIFSKLNVYWQRLTIFPLTPTQRVQIDNFFLKCSWSKKPLSMRSFTVSKLLCLVKIPAVTTQLVCCFVFHSYTNISFHQVGQQLKCWFWNCKRWYFPFHFKQKLNPNMFEMFMDSPGLKMYHLVIDFQWKYLFTCIYSIQASNHLRNRFIFILAHIYWWSQKNVFYLVTLWLPIPVS